MAKQSGGNTAQRVEALVRPIVEGMGLRLWDVVFEKEGPDWYLRVLIDRDGPMDTDLGSNFVLFHGSFRRHHSLPDPKSQLN